MELSTLYLSAALMAALSPAASAQTFTPALSAVVGSGSEESFFTLDFQSGTIDHNYAFGYKYEGTKSGADFLTALAAGTSLTVGYAPGYGPSDPNGVLVSSFAFNGQFQDSPGNSYWAYFTGPDGQNWTYSGVGASGRTLSNGSWDGWSWDADYSQPPFPAPTPLTPAAVPEASSAVSLGLLALLGASLFVARRKKMA